MTTAPTQIYYGLAEALQAEVALLPCYTDKYYIVVFRDDGMETPIGCDTKKQMIDEVKRFKREGFYPNAEWCHVS